MTNNRLRSFAKTSVAVLPWKLRKLVMFLLNTG
jgi:hypothetical protein